MKAFIVHRTAMRAEAKQFFDSLNASHSLNIKPYFLRKSFGANWKQKAESGINASEIVIVYDLEACQDSENTTWEMNRAREIGREVLEITHNEILSHDVQKIELAYNFQIEFDDCFSKYSANPDQLLEFYKIMVDSSEQLIRRRQITNGFFITVIGAILGAFGFAFKEGIITEGNSLVLILPIFIGLLMCRSWSNLVQNYGKLNAGKFNVIHALEKNFEYRIFEAEWIALGKGLRKEKYQSFTSTEQDVPRHFSYLLWVVLLIILLSAEWQHVFDAINQVQERVFLVAESVFRSLGHILTFRSVQSAPTPNEY